MFNNIIKLILYPIAYCIILFSKFVDLLNPLFYSAKRRLSTKFHGKLKFDSNITVVFVLYQKESIPFYVQNTLDVFKELKINCILNVNDDLSQDTIEELKNNCSELLVRKNFGLDFAAYKDSILQTDLSKCKRLIIMNDSIFLFKKGLKELFLRFIDNQYDVVGLSENISYPCWHIQSFLMSFSQLVIKDKTFIDFWKNYKPFTNRKYIVEQGEIAFSKLVLKKYYKNTNVIFNINVIANKYKNIAELETTLISQNMLYKYRKNKKVDSDNLLDFIEKSNITHAAPFLLQSLTGSMILKRDVVFKNSFSINSVYNNLTKLNIDDTEKEMVVKELKLRGNLSNSNLITRLLYIMGIK